MTCKICGSHAINQHFYDRETGVDTDLCDVHYWMKRAQFKVTAYYLIDPDTGQKHFYDASEILSDGAKKQLSPLYELENDN